MLEEIIEEKATLFDGCDCERDFFEAQAYFDAKVERYNKLYNRHLAKLICIPQQNHGQS